MPHVTYREMAYPGTRFGQLAATGNIGRQVPCYINGAPAGLTTIADLVVAEDGTSIDITYDLPVALGEHDKFSVDPFSISLAP